MTPELLAQAMQATWPAAASHRAGPWTIRDGAGGGKRVSAATADAPWQDSDIALAEREMIAMAQPCLFLIRETDDALDAALQARGYRVVDPVSAFATPVARLTDPPPPALSAFAHWPPLAICETLWAEGGIGPERMAVMQRAAGPKCAVLSRVNDHPTGTAFVALHHKIAMLHALEVTPAARRQGSAHSIMRVAADWAQQNGAEVLCVVATRANTAARALYASLHMQDVGQYHYRQK